MTSLFSLMTLNYFKTYMILTKLGPFCFGIILAWSDVCCQRTELEIKSKLVNIEIFLSLLNWLYIIKKIKYFCQISLISFVY